MCRLLGVVCAEPISIEKAVGAHVLKDFVALTQVHGDGWGGIAAAGEGGPRVHVSAQSAVRDQAFPRVYAGLALDRQHRASALGDKRSGGTAGEFAPPLRGRRSGDGAQRFDQAG